jgi:hypothetical protein
MRLVARREEVFRVPRRRCKKRLVGIDIQVGPFSPIRPNVVEAVNFQFDITVDGRQIKLLNLIGLLRSVEHWCSCAVTVVPSSFFTPSMTGADLTAPTQCSSNRARPGRTPGSRASTVGSATNSATPGDWTTKRGPLKRIRQPCSEVWACAGLPVTGRHRAHASARTIV